MIYDGHAYCFPDLRGDGGFGDPDQFRRHMQLAIAHHFQPVWRERDRTPADASGLADPSGAWDFDGLKEASFRPAGHGRFEWTVGGEEYVKQYMPPSVTDMSYHPDKLVAEMDYAGVDMALLHRTAYLGISNEFIADCVRRFPDRLQGLAYVEEWLIRQEPEASIDKLRTAITRLGLHGLQFLPDHMSLYGQTEDWTSPDFGPYWDALASLDVPLFITPSYSALAVGTTRLEGLLAELTKVRRWMERYPEVKVVLTHGLAWRMFIERDGLNVPDEVFDALPLDNPNFYLQVLFAIFLGGVWDYPMPQVRTTMEKLVDRVGLERLMWGTDMPMVMRFYTYRQCQAHMRVVCDFLSHAEQDMILGGNAARLMGAAPAP